MVQWAHITYPRETKSEPRQRDKSSTHTTGFKKMKIKQQRVAGVKCPPIPGAVKPSSDKCLLLKSLLLNFIRVQTIKQAHTFPVEEFKRFRRKPELLLLTGVKIVLLKVWRTVLDLFRGGRGGRHLISFFKTGIVGCFSKIKTKHSGVHSRQTPC